MSKTSNIQRTESLRLWMAVHLKHKNREAVIFIDPSKRRTVYEKGQPKIQDDFELDVPSSQSNNRLIKSIAPIKRKRYA